MVNDGCADILCFTPQRFNLPFQIDDLLLERISAAFRNLSCVFSNQDMLARAGSIVRIVEMCTPSDEKKIGKSAFQTIRKNCASALRSMTYNIAIRQELVESGAIRIILFDLNKNFEGENIAITNELLCELEAESWCNGSRGAIKENRAPPINPCELCFDLLGGTPNVKLNIGSVTVPQTKYLVKVVLEEPPIETEGALQSVGDALQYLTSIATAEEALQPPTCVYGKQESEVNKTIKRLSVITTNVSQSPKALETISSAGEDSDDEINSVKSNSSLQKHEEVSLSDSASLLIGALTYDSNSSDIIKTNKSIAEEDAAAQKESDSMRSKLPSLTKKLSLRGIETSDDDNSSLGSSVLSSTRDNKLKRSTTNMRKDPNEFKGLVALINHEGKLKHGNVSRVLERWELMSKY
jgi:hypothetical protein